MRNAFIEAKDIDCTQFTTLSEFYKFLDNHALELEVNHDVLEAWVKFRDQLTNPEDKKIAQWEIDCFCFSFIGDSLFSFSVSIDKKTSKPNEYPRLDKFQEEAYDYLKSRAKSAQSNLLSARYNHLLCKSSVTKNRSYGVAALNYYIEGIHRYYKLLLKNESNENFIPIGRYFENLVGLVTEINLHLDKVYELTDFLFFKAEIIPFYIKHGIVETMLKYHKVFKPKDFCGVLQLFENGKGEATARTDNFCGLQHIFLLQ